MDESDIFMRVMPKKTLRRIYNYDDYIKVMNQDEITSLQELNIEVLNILQDMGFDFNMDGTYLTADIIMAAYIFFKNSLTDNRKNYQICYDYLQRLMKNPYSQFYFDLARNEHAMGTTLLHNKVNDAYLLRNKSVDTELKINEYCDIDNIYAICLSVASSMYADTLKKDKVRE